MPTGVGGESLTLARVTQKLGALDLSEPQREALVSLMRFLARHVPGEVFDRVGDSVCFHWRPYGWDNHRFIRIMKDGSVRWDTAQLRRLGAAQRASHAAIGRLDALLTHVAGEEVDGEREMFCDRIVDEDAREQVLDGVREFMKDLK